MADNKRTRDRVLADLIAHGETEERAREIVAIEFGDSPGDVITLDREGNLVDDAPAPPWDRLQADDTTRTPPKRD